MVRRKFLWLTGAAAIAQTTARPRPKNIVVILADDIGYGDLVCYGATKVRTPNLDKLAAEGLRFTDAHSAAATCTPTRYSLMTGEYAWRKPGTGVLPGNANLIIEPQRTTLPKVLQAAGYRTGCVGKWHLGLGSGNIDWNREIRPGPKETGFEYSFIIPATGDRTPCVYVENGRVAGLDPKDPIEVSYSTPVGKEPTGKDHPELLKIPLSRGHDQTIVNGISRIGYMSGGASARWRDEDMADTITKKATAFIEQHRSSPFFLYFATHDVHVPRVPHPRFRKSQCGIRCDAIEELDWSVGEILKTLERLGLARDTLVVFTSDNGAVIDDGYADGAEKDLNGHTPSGSLRGGKYSPYEGGTRVPFLLRWPSQVKPGVSDALVCQVDLMASFAALTGQTLAQNAGPDSLDILPALLGRAKAGRETLIEQARVLSVRKGRWKLIPAAKEGQPAELYDLASDLSESKNLASSQPARVEELQSLLTAAKKNGRTR